MNVETSIMLKSILEHGEHGVNAMLATVPRFTGDPEPQAVTVYCDVLNSDLFDRGETLTPPQTPALVVITDANLDLKVDEKAALVAQVLTTSIALVTSTENLVGDGDEAMLKRVTGYTMRAVKKTLRRANDGRCINPSMRSYNGVKLVRVARVQQFWGESGVGRAGLTGFVLVDTVVQDEQP